MNQTLEQVKMAASNLSESERAELAHYLLESLEPAEEGVADAWRAELSRRVAALESGEAVGTPSGEVLTRLRELYP